jgi:hypothetical protein
MRLHFAPANAKIKALENSSFARKGKVYSFSLLSGHTCPYAKDCLSKAVEDGQGKRHIEDGPHTQFRCFSASQEVLFSQVYRTRKENHALVELAAVSVSDAAAAILANIPKKATIIRIHVGGDFHTKAYMAAWLEVARLRSDIIFYAYTKSLPFWVSLRDAMPQNFILTASYGGWKDGLIEKEKLRYSKVVFSVDEAKQLSLEIDHDDSHAANPEKREESFALLLHGTQPKGSKAAEALRALDGLGTYGRGAKK